MSIAIVIMRHVIPYWWCYSNTSCSMNVMSCAWSGPIGMIVYTASLVNLRLLIVIALILVGIDIEISVNMFNLFLSIGIWNIGLMSSSAILVLVVLQVSYFVVVFSMTYIVNDSMCYSMYNSNIVNTLRRLNSITSVFIWSMVVLVESESVIVVLLSWDLLGVTSYLLVQYYNRSVRLNTAILTLMSSRVGDICLFIFLAQIVGSSSMRIVSGSISGLGSIMCVVAITKRAQFPISSWENMMLCYWRGLGTSLVEYCH